MTNGSRKVGPEKWFDKKGAMLKFERYLIIVEAVEKYNYHEKEVADYLGLH